MNGYDALTATEAGKLLNVNPQMLRVQVRTGQGMFSKLGTASKNKSGRYTYIFYKPMLLRFLKGGDEYEEENKNN